MPWQSARMEMPEEWWDAIRDKDRLPSWFRELTTWIESFGAWTHMHTQTFRLALSGWEAARRYSRFLVEHGSSWMLTTVLWAVEPHPGGHGSHIHALWSSRYDACATYSKGVLPLYRLVKEQSVSDSLGFSRLWPLNEHQCRVAAYCLKYILKSLKALSQTRIPMPWEPMEREPLWGIWTNGPVDTSGAGACAATT